MLEGMLILWTILTALSLVFIIYDLIIVTPEAGIMKVAWVLVVLYTGPIGLFFYFMTCREPLPKAHEEFIKPLWKQSTGSEVHCLAGDVAGIIIVAIVLSFFAIPLFLDLIFEYLGGFFFGLFIFQALFMKKMMGGTYIKAVKNTFYSEFVSMNYIMAAMIPVMAIWERFDALSVNPGSLHFWGKVSLASILAGFVAYPVNRWLVKNGLKHGMMTVRKNMEEEIKAEHGHAHHTMKPPVSKKQLNLALYLSIGFLGLGIVVAIIGFFA